MIASSLTVPRAARSNASRLLGTILLAVSLAACSHDSPRPSTATAAEASFAQQVRAVREGSSSQIRLDRAPVTDADLQQLDGLEDKLERINLSRTDISDQGLALLGKMQRLVQLRLASHRITDAGMAHLKPLAGLRFLHLIGAPVGDRGLETLHVLRRLESVYLDGTRVTEEGIVRLLEALPNVHVHLDQRHHPLDPHGSDHQHDAAPAPPGS